MTNKIYEKMKRVGRKAIAPLVIGTSLYLGTPAYSENLPVREEVSKVIVHEAERERNEYLGKIDKSFNDAIRDRRLDLEEQKKIYGYFVELREKQPFYDIPESYSKLRSLLKENLYGIDIGTPELEKKLNAGGLDVRVKGECNGGEIFVGILLSLFLSFLGVETIKSRS